MPNEQTLQPRLLTIPQAAKYLNSSVWSVRDLLWRRELPCVKLGKKFLLDLTDVNKWIERTKGTL